MTRSSLLYAGASVAGLWLASALPAGCNDDVVTCEVDTDCDIGVCRGGECIYVDPNNEGGVDANVTPPLCAIVAASCSLDGDCCSNRCLVNRCAEAASSSGASGRPGSSSGSSGSSGSSSGASSSGGTTCVDLYGVCLQSTDCCSGLSCLTSVCR